MFKPMLLVLMLVSVIMADISGIVMGDSGGLKPVSNATIIVSGAFNATLTTGADGTFKLLTTGISYKRTSNQLNVATILNNQLTLQLNKSSMVTVYSYNAAGQLVNKIAKEYSIGQHIVSLNKSIEFRAYKVNVDNKEIRVNNANKTIASAAGSYTLTIKHPDIGKWIDTTFNVNDGYNGTIKLHTPDYVDANGNRYPTIKVGSYVIMSQPLRATKFPNGDTMHYITRPNMYTEDVKYCDVNLLPDSFDSNNPDSVLKKYGKLYNCWSNYNYRDTTTIGIYETIDTNKIKLYTGKLPKIVSDIFQKSGKLDVSNNTPYYTGFRTACAMWNGKLTLREVNDLPEDKRDKEYKSIYLYRPY